MSHAHAKNIKYQSKIILHTSLTLNSVYLVLRSLSQTMEHFIRWRLGRIPTPGKLILELMLSQQKQKPFIFMAYAAYQVGR